MTYYSTLLSRVLNTLTNNLKRTGDPLGFTTPYWSQWSEGPESSGDNHTLFLTARMYQMLPYITEMTAFLETVTPFVTSKYAEPLLKLKSLENLIDETNRYLAEPLVRIKSVPKKKLLQKTNRTLNGIREALNIAGENPGYIPECDFYSGVLLYELGLEEEVKPHVENVYASWKKRGVKRIITVDPHTTFMLKTVFQKFINGFDISVFHYLEILSGELNRNKAANGKLPGEMVIHDSCVMARELGIIDSLRKIAEYSGIRLVEPGDTGKNTACCGGPVEFAFPGLSRQISKERIKVLAEKNPNVLVSCPVCLINFEKYEQPMNIRIWDAGEVLYRNQFMGGNER